MSDDLVSNTAPLLEVAGLHAGYGASKVLFGMSLRVQPAQCTALLGRNGMGKSTTIKSIMGMVRASSGQVMFGGEAIQRMPTHVIARRGIGLVPEGRQIFPNLTVQENLVATAVARPAHLSASANSHTNSNTNGKANGNPNGNANAKAWSLERVYALFPRLAERKSNFGNQLSGGEQQMLAIGRALMTNPRLLILDEATEGLSPLVRREIWTALALLKSEGMAILIVDKNIAALLNLADSHHIVEKGCIVWKGGSDALRADRAIWSRYLSA